MFKNRMDLHTHSDNSPDGRHSITMMCEQAIAAGLRAIAITDHVDCADGIPVRYDMALRNSNFETHKAKAIFAGKLIVLSGVEVGQPLFDMDTYRDVTAHPLDVVLLSVHSTPSGGDYYEWDYHEHDPAAALDDYFDALLRHAEWGGYDCLAHLTYPFRYIFWRDNVDIDLGLYDDQIDAVLRAAAERGKAIEINTHGLRQFPREDILPDERILRRYRELGGEYLTIGSDAHKAGDIGAGIDEALQIAYDVGFRYTTLYLNREPMQIPIK